MLAQGELSNTTIGNTGVIEEADYAKILGHVNLALHTLSQRFILKTKEITLQQHADVSRYYIRSEHAGDTSELDDYTYLLYDEDMPLEDDLVKILSAYDSLGDELTLNDKYADEPIICVEPDVISMTPCDPVEQIVLVYQASYDKLIYTADLDPSKIQLDIPYFLITPILYFVANRVFSGITSSIAEGTTTPGMTYAAKYEVACRELQRDNLIPDVQDTGQQFSNNGWV